MKLFEYIYYRIYALYQKKDSNPEIYATNGIAVLQLSLLFSLYVLISLFIKLPNINNWLAVTLVVAVIALNWRKFGLHFDNRILEDRWSKESITKKKLRGWAILALIIISIFFPIVIGILRHNFGVLKN